MDNGGDREAPARGKVEGSGNLPWPDTFAAPVPTAKGERGGDPPPARRGSDVDGDRRAAVAVVEARRADPLDEIAGRLTQAAVQSGIARVSNDLRDFLIGKNISYGNSAFEPINVFSKLPAREGILLRIDDKLKRIRNGTAYPGDDNIKDLTGYLILLMVLDELERNGNV